jgi:hypothetical protein
MQEKPLHMAQRWSGVSLPRRLAKHILDFLSLDLYERYSYGCINGFARLDNLSSGS